MEKRLCYCRSCACFFIINPDKVCPKCRGKLVSSVVTEEEWNRSSAEQKAAYKASLSALGGTAGDGQSDQASQNQYSQNNNFQKDHSANAAARNKNSQNADTENKKTAHDTKSSYKEKGSNQAKKSGWKSALGKLLLVLAAGYLVFLIFRPYNGACTSYESAGKKVYKQISKYDPEVYVSYHSDHFNRIIGINDDINNILKEACRNNGNPREGDHLAMNAGWAGGEYTAVEQRDKTHNLNITLTMSYGTSKEQEEELKNKTNSILAGLNISEASDYEKVRAIYNYICSNVVYDYDHLDDDSYRLKYTAYAAAINGTAVCSGIADLFYYLATAAGLEARITINDIHAWNIVKVDGKYYYLDPTWDLGLSESEYRYFLRGSGDFVSILNGPEHAAHREDLMAGFLIGPKHPLSNVEQEYTISENAYVR